MDVSRPRRLSRPQCRNLVVRKEPIVSEKIRCFLAVEISDAVRRAAAEVVGNLRKGIQFTKARPSWARIDNQHFTVLFLGTRPPEEVEGFKTALGDLPGAIAPFRVEVGGLGVFPNERNPKVLWLGVSDGGDGFQALHKAVIGRLQKTGFEPERRPFHPHLTLARIKSYRGVAEMMDVVKSHRDAACGEFTASALTLFRSQLHPAGAIYTPLAHWRFEKTS